ncbi:MAG: hypothetical protein ACOCWO_02180 [Candidatus Muiribacteriaceae bacterium]
MRIIEKERLSDCKNGSRKYSLIFSENIEKRHIDILSEYGDMDYRPDFEKPYWKFDKGDYMLKGTTGKDSARLWLNNGEIDEVLKKIEGIFRSSEK